MKTSQLIPLCLIAITNLSIAATYKCNATYCCPVNLAGYTPNAVRFINCKPDGGATRCLLEITSTKSSNAPWTSSNNLWKDYVNFPSTMTQQAAFTAFNSGSATAYLQDMGSDGKSLMCVYSAQDKNGNSVTGFLGTNPNTKYTNCTANTGQYGYNC